MSLTNLPPSSFVTSHSSTTSASAFREPKPTSIGFSLFNSTVLPTYSVSTAAVPPPSTPAPGSTRVKVQGLVIGIAMAAVVVVMAAVTAGCFFHKRNQARTDEAPSSVREKEKT